MATDAFGRLRTALPYTTFEYYPTALTTNSTYDKDVWVNTTNGTGAISYSSDNYVQLQCSANSDYVIRQTKQPMVYQPGKSRLLLFSGVMFNRAISTDTAIARIGCFSTSGSTPVDGHYFETDGNTLWFCETIGSSATRVAQSSWNIDIFDGNGSSGISLTTSNVIKNMLIVIDQEWLGVGRVRVGFSINGITYYAHQFTHTTIAIPYTKTPRLPITYEIIGTTIGSAISMRQICCTCISEGGFVPLGKRLSIGTAATGFDMSTAGTKYVIVAIKPQDSYPTITIRPIHFDGAYPSGTAKIAKFELQLHSSNGSVGTISGTLSYTNFSDSATKYAIGNGTQTVSSDGYILTTAYTTAQTYVNFTPTEFEVQLSRCQATQYDTILLVGSGSANGMNVVGSLDVVESI